MQTMRPSCNFKYPYYYESRQICTNLFGAVLKQKVCSRWSITSCRTRKWDPSAVRQISWSWVWLVQAAPQMLWIGHSWTATCITGLWRGPNRVPNPCKNTPSSLEDRNWHQIHGTLFYPTVGYQLANPKPTHEQRKKGPGLGMAWKQLVYPRQYVWWEDGPFCRVVSLHVAVLVTCRYFWSTFICFHLHRIPTILSLLREIFRTVPCAGLFYFQPT